MQGARIAFGADSAVLGSGSRTCDPSTESVGSGIVAASGDASHHCGINRRKRARAYLRERR
ncbi:hypothetical protein XdyCFBP7245_16490 [Xanthomonas dyei]|uniref:Uncharacterized protein n=1 Tax=Xanthomonas dyei TaxID=743699 RepID=A0A2S7BZL7_9XANT|nr:hypothetical protein XdyCFBP7245_16490 [Xanthomonas dyei]